MAMLKCSACSEHRPQNYYSNNQLKKKSRRRCPDCINSRRSSQIDNTTPTLKTNVGDNKMSVKYEIDHLLGYWTRQYSIPLLSIPCDIVVKYKDSRAFEFSNKYKGDNVILENKDSTAINTNYLGRRNYGNVRTDYWIKSGIHRYDIQINVVANPGYAYGSYIGVVNKKWNGYQNKNKYLGYDKNSWTFYLWSDEQMGTNDHFISNYKISLKPKVNDIYRFIINMKKHKIQIWNKNNNKILEVTDIKANQLALALCLKRSTMTIIDYKQIE